MIIDPLELRDWLAWMRVALDTDAVELSVLGRGPDMLVLRLSWMHCTDGAHECARVITQEEMTHAIGADYALDALKRTALEAAR